MPRKTAQETTQPEAPNHRHHEPGGAVKPSVAPTKRYVTVKEAAPILGVEVGTLYQWVSRSPGTIDPIPFVKFSSRCLRFPLDELIAWAERRRARSL